MCYKISTKPVRVFNLVISSQMSLSQVTITLALLSPESHMLPHTTILKTIGVLFVVSAIGSLTSSSLCVFAEKFSKYPSQRFVQELQVLIDK